MTKADPKAELASKLVAKLDEIREKDEYPPTLAELRELVDPQATDEDWLKSLTHKTIADKVVFGSKKDLAAPIALTEDLDVLTDSDTLFLFALNQLATAEKPLHAVDKLVAKVEKPLQESFTATLQDRIANNDLPEGVAKTEVKGEVRLYLEKFPPPAPPQPKKSPSLLLAEQLVAALNESVAKGATVVGLNELAPEEKAGPLKKATEEEVFSKAVAQLPISKTLTLVTPLSARDCLPDSDRVFHEVLAAGTSSKKPFAPLVELAAVLPEDLRDLFIGKATEKISTDPLPNGVVVRTQGEQTVVGLTSNIPADVLLAEKVLAEMRRRREKGSKYPATLKDLALAVDPATTDETLTLLVANKEFKAAVVFSVTGNAALPIALVGDEKKLASHPAVLEYAVAQLSTEAEPLQPLTKIAGILDKAIRDAFKPAVPEMQSANKIPETITLENLKNGIHLRLTKYVPPPPPKPPEIVLAETLLAKVKEAKLNGAYPTKLSDLLQGLEPEDKTLKAALASDALKFAIVVAIPACKHSLVALSGDQELLATDARLPVLLLQELTSDDNEVFSLSELAKKLAPDVEATFQASMEKCLTAGQLPAGIGKLMIKKKAHLYLKS